jgi:EAL domain-containing protein
MRVAVNLSPVQFQNRTLVATVARALHDAGMPADRLELEITETVMLQDTEATLVTLGQLRDLGVRIAMDDFGTGYSSLGYLRRFPFDRIKIDQSFVRDINSKRDCGAIIRAVTGLSRELGIATTAEGVETQAQLDELLSAGCTEFQGYLFSPPSPAVQSPACAVRSPRFCGPRLPNPPRSPSSGHNTGSRKCAAMRHDIVPICRHSSPYCTALQQRDWNHGGFRRHPCATRSPARAGRDTDAGPRDACRHQRGRPCGGSGIRCRRRRARPG